MLSCCLTLARALPWGRSVHLPAAAPTAAAQRRTQIPLPLNLLCLARLRSVLPRRSLRPACTCSYGRTVN